MNRSIKALRSNFTRTAHHNLSHLHRRATTTTASHIRLARIRSSRRHPHFLMRTVQQALFNRSFSLAQNTKRTYVVRPSKFKEEIRPAHSLAKHKVVQYLFPQGAPRIDNIGYVHPTEEELFQLLITDREFINEEVHLDLKKRQRTLMESQRSKRDLEKSTGRPLPKVELKPKSILHSGQSVLSFHEFLERDFGSAEKLYPPRTRIQNRIACCISQLEEIRHPNTNFPILASHLKHLLYEVTAINRVHPSPEAHEFIDMYNHQTEHKMKQLYTESFKALLIYEILINETRKNCEEAFALMENRRDV